MSNVWKQASSPLWVSPLSVQHAEHFPRPRINAILAEAIKKPVTLVYAGMGYGKTIAVSDFARETRLPVMWIQFSEFDNVKSSFWENFIRSVEQIHKPLADAYRKAGFPETEEQLHQSALQRERMLADKRYLLVFDDLHFVKDAAVMNFLEHLLYDSPRGRMLIMICRELPKLNLSGLLVRGMIASVDEDALSFTENEISGYLLQQDLSAELPNLSLIHVDTAGWAFMVNFIVRILKKMPGYPGYARSFVKQSFFQLMEKEVWNALSERLQQFLVRLSLINHLTAELVSILAAGDEDLLVEFNNQQRVVYIRCDRYTGCYLIHQQFLEYLHSKQAILSPAAICDTYKTAAEWCVDNGFTIDALAYYEKIEDYQSLAHILCDSSTQLLLSSTQYLTRMFSDAPTDIFNRVENFATEHVRILILAGLWPEALERLRYYERQFLPLSETDGFERRALGVLYYFWAVLRQLMCLMDDVYDFDVYFEKVSKYPMLLSDVQTCDNYPIGPWINRTGMSRRGAPQEYCQALARSVEHMSRAKNTCLEGLDDLCQGELLFFQGEYDAAMPLIAGALMRATGNGQFVIRYVALFYVMRIAACRGNYKKMEQALQEMKATLESNEYYNRFAIYDLSRSFYYFILRCPEMFSGWLKGMFVPFPTTNSVESAGNMLKARYFYQTKNYAAVLAHIGEQKRQGGMLYGWLELLAIESCVHYQMKNIEKAWVALLEAYETALPNNIIMPFIELGKDMRTLTLAALGDSDCPVPGPWLKNINKKSSLYARRQTLLISEYKKANSINIEMSLTRREMKVLHDLYQGLSRSEIAGIHCLSINTVRIIIRRIYEKLQARNLADLIRIVYERKLI